MQKPLFIVIEGLDGAGTTTQCKQVTRALRKLGRRAAPTQEPTDMHLGNFIRSAIAGGGVLWTDKPDEKALALLFAADRVAHGHYISEAMEMGNDVVCDRYTLSSYAYQGRQDLPWVVELNKYALQPDVVIFLDVGVETCLERLSKRQSKDIYENREVLMQIDSMYHDLLGHVDVVIDGEAQVDEVTQAIMRKLEEYL